jgi:RNA polymerase sigma-70 factor (ECF subfamily)
VTLAGTAPSGAGWYDALSFRGASTDPAREDAETAAGFLGGEAAAIALVDRWIAGAAAPFRNRLATEWPDLLQEIRLEVFRLLQRSSWRGEARLKTYVWRVATHSSLDAVRRLRRRPVHEPADAEAPLPSRDPSPLDQALEGDTGRRLLAALAAVPEDCRQLWQGILGGLSYREISGQMGVSEGALRVRAHRCRKRALEALGGNLAAGRAAQG